MNPFDKVTLELNRKITSLEEENAALKEQVAQLTGWKEVADNHYGCIESLEEQVKQLEEMAEVVQVLRDALINHQKLTRPIEKSMQALAFQSSPDTLAARDQRVAEACAKVAVPKVGTSYDDYNLTIRKQITEAIRSGKWREYQ